MDVSVENNSVGPVLLGERRLIDLAVPLRLGPTEKSLEAPSASHEVILRCNPPLVEVLLLPELVLRRLSRLLVEDILAKADEGA